MSNDELNPAWAPDLLTPEIMDRLADLVVTKLTERMEGGTSLARRNPEVRISSDPPKGTFSQPTIDAFLELSIATKET